MTIITDFFSYYEWAGPIVWTLVGALGGVIVFLAAQYWLRAEFGLKRTMVQKELYARLQVLQGQASDAIVRYLPLRDQRFSQKDATKVEEHDKVREVQRNFEGEKGKLVGLIREYNQLESKLAKMEKRQPRWFVLPLPPMAPTG